MGNLTTETLQRRILIFGALAVLLTGLVVAAVVLVPLAVTATRSAHAELRHELGLRAVTLRQYTGSLQEVTLQLTSRTRIREELARYVAGEISAEQLEAFTRPKLIDPMEQSADMVGIVRLGHDGVPLVTVGEALPPEAFSMPRPAPGKPVQLGPVATPAGPRLLVAAAIVHGGAVIGTDVAAFDATRLGSMLAEHRVGSLEAVALIQAGDIWWSGEGAGHALTARPPPPVLPVGDEVVEAGRAGHGVVVVATTLADSGWRLALTTSVKLVYGPVWSVVLLAVLATGLLITAGVFAVIKLLHPLAGHTIVRSQEMENQLAELRRLGRALEAERRALEESNRDLEQFAYAASHDLQQPLRMVSSFLDLLRRRLGDRADPESREFMAFAIDGAEQMRRMIQALLEYSRVGRIEHAPEPVDLGVACDHALTHLRPAVEESGAHIEVGPLPTVRAEPTQMMRVFQNLIDNAIKYRDPARPLTIRISAQAVPEGWRISVADTGQGIDTADQARAFQLFQRLGRRDDAAGPVGTGMGLALCQKIVQRHGGTITLDSVAGAGTTVSFTLPLSRPPAASSPQASQPPMSVAEIS